MTPTGAVGFFDSGVGGLSVLRHALDQFAGLPLLYVADSAYAPYGRRTQQQVLARARLITGFLVDQGARCVVLACNTATALAVETLRAEFEVPIVGMEPALKPAAALTRGGGIAVLATPGTLGSGRFARLLSDHAGTVRVHAIECAGWVEAVETGVNDCAVTSRLVAEALRPARDEGVDTYVLGCTHFPFLEKAIRQAAGDSAALIDPGPAVVRQARRRMHLEAEDPRLSTVRLYSSGPPERLRDQARDLIGLHAEAFPLPV
jgi:glutamate racemase